MTPMADADVVSLHLLLTDETRGMIDEPMLRSLKSGAPLINTARAELIARGALERVLTEGRIAAALTCSRPSRSPPTPRCARCRAYCLWAAAAGEGIDFPHAAQVIRIRRDTRAIAHPHSLQPRKNPNPRRHPTIDSGLSDFADLLAKERGLADNLVERVPAARSEAQ
jgi:D-isomer specific 2-hydroxyacid dehydrogenase, NAD binding domain